MFNILNRWSSNFHCLYKSSSSDNRIKITVKRIIYLEICFHDINNKYKFKQICNTFLKQIIITNYFTLYYYSINVMHNLSCYKV